MNSFSWLCSLNVSIVVPWDKGKPSLISSFLPRYQRMQFSCIHAFCLLNTPSSHEQQVRFAARSLDFRALLQLEEQQRPIPNSKSPQLVIGMICQLFHRGMDHATTALRSYRMCLTRQYPKSSGIRGFGWPMPPFPQSQTSGEHQALLLKALWFTSFTNKHLEHHLLPADSQRDLI